MALNQIINRIGYSISKSGFRKKHDNWYWSNEQVVLVLNFQKSLYGEKWFINCAIGLKELGLEDYPKEHLCHIRYRASSIMSSNDQELLEVIMDMENESVKDEKRLNEAARLLEESIIPELKKFDSRKSMLDAISAGLFSKAMVHKQVKELCVHRVVE